MRSISFQPDGRMQLTNVLGDGMSLSQVRGSEHAEMRTMLSCDYTTSLRDRSNHAHTLTLAISKLKYILSEPKFYYFANALGVAYWIWPALYELKPAVMRSDFYTLPAASTCLVRSLSPDSYNAVPAPWWRDTPRGCRGDRSSGLRQMPDSVTV